MMLTLSAERQRIEAEKIAAEQTLNERLKEQKLARDFELLQEKSASAEIDQPSSRKPPVNAVPLGNAKKLVALKCLIFSCRVSSSAVPISWTMMGLAGLQPGRFPPHRSPCQQFCSREDVRRLPPAAAGRPAAPQRMGEKAWFPQLSRRTSRCRSQTIHRGHDLEIAIARAGWK